MYLNFTPAEIAMIIMAELILIFVSLLYYFYEPSKIFFGERNLKTILKNSL